MGLIASACGVNQASVSERFCGVNQAGPPALLAEPRGAAPFLLGGRARGALRDAARESAAAPFLALSLRNGRRPVHLLAVLQDYNLTIRTLTLKLLTVLAANPGLPAAVRRYLWRGTEEMLQPCLIDPRLISLIALPQAADMLSAGNLGQRLPGLISVSVTVQSVQQRVHEHVGRLDRAASSRQCRLSDGTQKDGMY